MKRPPRSHLPGWKNCAVPQASDLRRGRSEGRDDTGHPNVEAFGSERNGLREPRLEMVERSRA